MDEEEMTSSEDNSYRSDENVPPAAPEETPLAGQLTDAAPSKTPSQHADLLVANAKLRVLESDLARSQLESKQLEEQVAVLKADLQKTNVNLQEMTANLEEATANYTASRTQYDYLQKTYNLASGTTMRLKRENEDLTEDNEKLKAQVEMGLQQKQLFLDSFIEAKDREIDQLKAQNEMLLQQAQKTDRLRESASRLLQVEAQLRHMEADRAACGECQRRLDSRISNDSDTEYQSYKKIVFDNDTELRGTRSRARANQEIAPTPVERFVPTKPALHAPEQALQNAEARKKLPLTDLRRWAHDQDIVSRDETPETQPGVDVAEVDMVHICKWRPEHGNACCALFANTEVRNRF